MFRFDEKPENLGWRNSVMGVGGGGFNSVEHMLAQNIKDVDLICANTDEISLGQCSTQSRLKIDWDISYPKGTDNNPSAGHHAALKSRKSIESVLVPADSLFLIVGLGGCTGTGAAPVIAKIAQEIGINFITAVVTTPFNFERRSHIAEIGIQELLKYVNTLIVICNDKVLSLSGKNIRLLDAFNMSNSIITNTVRSITDFNTYPGLMNHSMEDIRHVIRNMGKATVGGGCATGEDRAKNAAESALNNPILNINSATVVQYVLVNITAGINLSINEYDTVYQIIRNHVPADANVTVASVINSNLDDEFQVTIIANGRFSNMPTQGQGNNNSDDKPTLDYFDNNFPPFSYPYSVLC